MPRSLTSTYPKKSDRFDEMIAGNGQLRPAWQSFYDHLNAASPEQMRHRLNFVRRRIQENGITYNVYADPNGADRPWELDPLPLILSAGEWQDISKAGNHASNYPEGTTAQRRTRRSLWRTDPAP